MTCHRVLFAFSRCLLGFIARRIELVAVLAASALSGRLVIHVERNRFLIFEQITRGIAAARKEKRRDENWEMALFRKHHRSQKPASRSDRGNHQRSNRRLKGRTRRCTPAGTALPSSSIIYTRSLSKRFLRTLCIHHSHVWTLHIENIRWRRVHLNSLNLTLFGNITQS